MTRHPARDWLADAIVQQQLAQVEAQIHDTATDGGGICPSFHRQLLSPNSKRLRPALLLLAARFGEVGHDDVLLRAAAATEQVHEATLYHDDIVDLAEVRRGSPAAHTISGPAAAALAGSELLYANAELCAQLPRRDRLEIARTGEILCRGLACELETVCEERMTPLRRVMIMVDKSASVFRLAVQLGCSLAGVPRPIRGTLTNFAVRFGLCFQLVDDVADIRGSKQSSTRGRGEDLRMGIYTLPILYAMRDGRPKRRKLLAALRALRYEQDQESLDEALQLVEELDGVARARAVLFSWIRGAATQLERLPRGQVDDAVESLERLLALTRATVEEGMPPAQPVGRDLDSTTTYWMN